MGAGAGGRVVKPLGSIARGPGFESRCCRVPKVLGSDGIICKYLSLCVYPVYVHVFVVSVCID